MKTDKRPDPKPRKHPQLWQAYLWWREMNELKKRHILRESSITKGKSNLDADFERLILSTLPFVDEVDEEGYRILMPEKEALKRMKLYGERVGPIWDWLVSIRGIAEPTAAKLLAQFDDVAKFEKISRFWRFSGWGTYEYWKDSRGKLVAPKDGYKWITNKNDVREKIHVVTEPKAGWELVRSIDRCLPGWHSPFNRILKSEVWIVATNFVRAQTPLYVDIYYKEKDRQHALHPEVVVVNGRRDFTDGHLEQRAKRKMAKIFLSHLWLKWREFDGLPVTVPWILREGSGHSTYIAPPS